mgnify:CR=1 FL=1
MCALTTTALICCMSDAWLVGKCGGDGERVGYNVGINAQNVCCPHIAPTPM